VPQCKMLGIVLTTSPFSCTTYYCTSSFHFSFFYRRFLSFYTSQPKVKDIPIPNDLPFGLPSGRIINLLIGIALTNIEAVARSGLSDSDLDDIVGEPLFGYTVKSWNRRGKCQFYASLRTDISRRPTDATILATSVYLSRV
jgi:hypothetical protein